jgi:hypothetical protein
MTALAMVLALLLAPAWAHAVWSADATGETSVGAATLGNASGLTAACATAAADSSVTLAWTASPDSYVTAYDVVRTAAPGGAQTTSTTAAAATTATDSPPTGNGLSYTYAIRARAAQWSTDLLVAADAVAYTTTSCSPALAPAPAPLALLSVLAGTGGVTSTGPTVVSGDLGVAAGQAFVGFPPGVVSGSTSLGNAAAAQARTAMVSAYDEANASVPTHQFSGDLNGLTFHAGVHHTAAALALTGKLTLDGQGDPAARFVVQVDAALNTAAASEVVLVNGAQAANVVWQVEGAVGLGASSTFVGTILAWGGITVGSGAQLVGRALSDKAVTLASNTIQFTSAPAPTVTIAGGSAAATSDTTPSITGVTSAAQGATVTVTLAGQTLTTTAGAAGAWAVTAAALAGGTYEVRAAVRDAAGNAGTAVQSLTVEVNPDPVELQSLSSFAVVAGTGGVTSTGMTVVTGDLAIGPGSPLVGFPDGQVIGSTHLGDATAVQAQEHLISAYDGVNGRVPTAEFSGDLNGRTLRAGVHHTAAALALTGTLTLDGRGDPDARFVVQVDAALNTAAGSTVLLVNGAQAANVVWQVEGAAGLGADSTFAGTVMAAGGITIGAGAQLTGRVLSYGAVTLADNRLN